MPRYNVSYTLPSGEKGFTCVDINTNNENSIKAHIEKICGSPIKIKYIKVANSSGSEALTVDSDYGYFQ